MGQEQPHYNYCWDGPRGNEQRELKKKKKKNKDSSSKKELVRARPEIEGLRGGSSSPL